MIEIFRPYMPAIEKVSTILKSKKLNYGKYGILFENSLGEYIGNSNVCTISTFNIAMFILFSSLGLEQGDTVLLSPLACLESTMPVKAFGLLIEWVDVDPLTGTMSPVHLKSKINSKVKLIIHNHFCGNVGHIAEINGIAAEHGIYVLDDGIDAFGSEYRGKKLGNVGSDFTIFNFSYVRLPNTLQGAAIFTKNKKHLNKIKIIRDNGIQRENFRDIHGEINASCDIYTIGYSGLMSELNSYIGYQTMKNINKLILNQRENAKLWNELLSLYYPSSNTFDRNDSNPNYWVFGIITDNKESLFRWFREKGFMTSSVHINNNIYSVFNNSEKLKGVDIFMRSFLAIPSGWWVKRKYIYELIEEII